MNRHDTPDDVASELARHAPQRLGAVLDPAVGSGSLLMPLLRRLQLQKATVVCVDSDHNAIAEVKKELGARRLTKVSFVRSDFLKWSDGSRAKFDCIVMNPPFAAIKSQLTQIQLPRTLQQPVGPQRYMPLEAAFVCRAIQLLKDEGRLLAILPCSVVMSESTQWLRDLMFSSGAIRFVHELPPRSFPNVESRMYLVVFDKAAKQRKVVLFNHDLSDPERLDVWLKATRPIERLDFGYHKACERLGRLIGNPRFVWRTCDEVALVLRGNQASPLGPARAVHTTDYTDGFWRRSNRHTPGTGVGAKWTVKRGDILVKRVGRNCYKTFGPTVGLIGMPCTDCVLLLRPKEARQSTRLLFAIQAICELGWAKALLERGTGASYVSVASLQQFAIPTMLHSLFPKTYASFSLAIRQRSSGRARRAVRYAANRIDRLADA